MKNLFFLLIAFVNVGFGQTGVGIEYNNRIDSQINLVTGMRTNETLGGRRTDLAVGIQTFENNGSNNSSYNIINLGASSSFLFPLKQMIQLSVGGRVDYQYISNKDNYNNNKGIDRDPSTIGLITGLVFSPSYHPDYEIYVQISAISSEKSGYDEHTDKSDPVASSITFFNKGAIGIKYYL